MAVKITIAVEKTASDQDLEETLNITVATKGECEFLFLIFLNNIQAKSL